MTESPRIEGLLRRIGREIRRRRAEYYGLRGAFWGAVAGVAVLLAKHALAGRAPWIAASLMVLGGLAGVVYGAARGIRRGDVARVADRAFGLDDRVATTLEWADRPDRTPLVDALITDTVARVESLQIKRVVKRVVPREGQLLLFPVLAALVLMVMPPIPLPSGRLPDFLSSTEEEREERTGSSMLEETTRQLSKDPLKRPSFEERDFAQRAGGSGATTTGDLSAIFKDTSLANSRPDFNSFMKKGDERLRMLEQTDRMPDLQSDFTNSQYKMVYRKSKALTGGLRRAYAAGASPSAAGEAKTAHAATAWVQRTRISAKARGSCPAKAGAGTRRARPPSASAPTRSTWASRGSRGRAARTATIPT